MTESAASPCVKMVFVLAKERTCCPSPTFARNLLGSKSPLLVDTMCRERCGTLFLAILCYVSGLYEDNSTPMCGIVQMIFYGRHLPVPLGRLRGSECIWTGLTRCQVVSL